MSAAVTAPPERHGGFAAAVTIGVLQTVLGMLPAFLVGAMAVQIRADLDFPADRLGTAVMAFFLVSGLCYALLGKAVERLGVGRATALGAGCASAALLGIAAAPSAVWLTPLLVVGGPGNAASQLAANLRLAGAVQRGQQGLAFGIKQAAVPLASVLGGLAVPALALTVGWRAAFLAGPALLVPIVVLSRRAATRAAPAATASSGAGELVTARRHLWSLSLAAGLGTAATNILAVFYVDAVVHGGVPEGVAGLMLAAGSTLGALVRVLAGWSADRRSGRHLVVVAAMLAASAVGYALLAVPTRGAALLAITALTFITGWGWNGLLTFAVVRFNPAAPAQATGVTQTGVSVGGAIGPAIAGLLAVRGSYAAVWLACAVAVSVAAALVVLTRRRMISAG